MGRFWTILRSVLGGNRKPITLVTGFVALTHDAIVDVSLSHSSAVDVALMDEALAFVDLPHFATAEVTLP